MADLKAFAEQLVNLSVKEVNELAQILKDEYGIEPAAAAVAVAAGPAAGAAAEEEKSAFDVFKNFWYPHEIKISQTGKDAQNLESRFAGNHYWNKALVSGKELIMYTDTQISGAVKVDFID